MNEANCKDSNTEQDGEQEPIQRYDKDQSGQIVPAIGGHFVWFADHERLVNKLLKAKSVDSLSLASTGELFYDGIAYLMLQTKEGPTMFAEIRGRGADLPQDVNARKLCELWNANLLAKDSLSPSEPTEVLKGISGGLAMAEACVANPQMCLSVIRAMIRQVDKALAKGSPSTECQPVPSGEWVQPIVDGYRMQCCDCGLIHRMDFRVEDGRAQFRAFREPPAIADAEERKESRRITFSGKSWLEWHEHIDSLFAAATPGEDIPFNAILAWPGIPDAEDIAWAKGEIRDAIHVEKVGSPSEEGAGQ